MKNDDTLQNNILIKFLKTISEDEWKEFNKFVDSPYFNKGRNYLPLLKILKTFYPDFDSGNFTKENIYKKLYPDNQYKESVLSSMLSRLYTIGEEFLIQVALEKNNHLMRERLIMSELHSRGATLKVNKLIDNILTDLETKKIGLLDFQNKKEIKVVIDNFERKNYEEEKLYDSVLGIFSSSLNSFFFDIHFYNGILYSQRNFWKEDFEKSYIAGILDCIDVEKIMELIKKNDPKSYVPLNLYYLSFKAVKDPEADEHYFNLKEYFFENYKKLDDSFKLMIFNNLWRLCAIKAVRGNRDFLNEGFEIRKKMVEEDLLTGPDNHILVSEFRSTLIDAINVNQLDWAEGFTKKYIKKLHPDFRKDIEKYGKAFLAYARGDYDTAIEIGSKLNINQIMFKFDMKNILSKIYYETSSTEPLHSLLNTYYQLINNYEAKDNDYSKRHKNFVLYLRRLLSLKEKNKSDAAELEMLKDKIRNDNVTSRSWLIKKIDKLL